MNRWNIPDWLENEVRARDTSCIYCRTVFKNNPKTRRDRASWEHIINNAKIITRENIALCCMGCNASKGAKVLSSWLMSKYCLDRKISPDTIALVAKAALAAEKMADDYHLKK